MRQSGTSERPQTAAVGRERSENGHGAKSETVRERAILALLSERNVTEAAQRSGVGVRTLRRWLAEDSAFKKQYDEARAATFQVGLDRVQILMVLAVDTLEELLAAKKYPSVRLGAARTIAELAIHQRDAETILRRLSEIERTQRDQAGNRSTDDAVEIDLLRARTS